MDGQEQMDSWSWRDAARASARNGRTALLAVWTLAAVVAAMGPPETFAAYGRLLAGTEVGTDSGRLIFLGMGAAQATLLALVVGCGSLSVRLGARALRLARDALARGSRGAEGAAHG